MDYKAMYQEKLTTADEAVKVVKNGDWVDYGWCVGTPDVLDQAMAKRLPRDEGRQLPRRRADARACDLQD